MKLKTLSIEVLKNELLRVFKRFPLTSVIVTVATLLLMVVAHKDIELNDNKIIYHSLIALFLGFPLSLAFHLISENKPTWLKLPSSLIPYLSLPIMVAYYYFLQSNDSGTGIFIRIVHWALYCHLLVAFAPFLANPDPRSLWSFNYKLFIGFFISRFFSSFLNVGIFIGITAFTGLLEIKVDGRIYGYVAAFCLVWISTMHFLALVPKDVAVEESEQPKVLKLFCQYILVPLNVLYILILYSYMAKILVTGAWPSGIISWLVIGVSVLGVFALLMMYTFQRQSENQWMRKFQLGYYISIIPLLLMALIAIGMRIDQYQITEKRYGLVVLCFWLMGVAIYFLASKAKNITVIPFSLFCVALITSFGPWSIYQVSWRNQVTRLEEILNRNGMLEEGQLVKNTAKLSVVDAKEMKDLIYYLVNYHGPQNLPSFFSIGDRERLNTEQKKSYRIADTVEYFMKDRFILPREFDSGFVKSEKIYSYQFGERVVRLDANTIYFVFSELETFFTEKGKKYVLLVDKKTNILKLTENDKVLLNWDLTSSFKALEQRKENYPVWKHSNSRVEAILIPSRVEVYQDKESGDIGEFEFAGELIVKLKP